MKARIALGSIAAMCVLSLPAFASGVIQGYFTDAAHKVEATENPLEKRQILDRSFRTISTALGVVQSLPLVSKDDVAAIARLKAKIQENQDELTGSNGYVRVPDTQLNAFSHYVVQNLEQADVTITISLLALVLIAIIVLLLI